MNRSVIQSVGTGQRGIVLDSADHKKQVDAWTARLLAREPCVPEGHRFSWQRGASSATNTAYLFDAAMCNVQYAQSQLHRASTLVGQQEYKACKSAACAYARVITEIMPQWTFVPREVYGVPDASAHDIYGHYCLARAMTYAAVGKADLKCSRKGQIAAGANAAHLYTVAAQLIDGDTNSMIESAQICTGNVLKHWGDAFLESWDKDEDPEGAAKSLACYTEAHARYTAAGRAGCPDRVMFAYERNQVNWIKPVLPEWHTLVRARVTAL
jgi:hypothetical protein